MPLEAAHAGGARNRGLGRKLREDHRLKVRKPMPQLTVVHRDPDVRAAAEAGAARIGAELNVKR